MKKIPAIILSAIIAVSILSLAASAYAMPFMHWKAFQNMGNGNSHAAATQQSFVRLDGFISMWGDTNVTGTIQVQSRTVVVNNTDIRQGSSATAMWTTNTSRAINAVRDRENFTYNFYTARLTNASVSSLNVTGYSFFLNGTWSVYNVTSSFTVTTDSSGSITGFHRSQDAVALVTNAYGEFKIASGEGNFTLTITGIDDSLNGSVRVQKITTKMFNPFKINNSDNFATLTKADVSTIVTAFGASPGWGNYNQNMDYNFNYRVDICDLATAAANLNS
ncbi:MAG: hypothetical protein NWF05_00575 [Candidatus Bathyarchaeota archaeon]|nr:hypothetical protein [Candidatus Bathyarchaeota archaeon]